MKRRSRGKPPATADARQRRRQEKRPGKRLKEDKEAEQREVNNTAATKRQKSKNHVEPKAQDRHQQAIVHEAAPRHAA